MTTTTTKKKRAGGPKRGRREAELRGPSRPPRRGGVSDLPLDTVRHEEQRAGVPVVPRIGLVVPVSGACDFDAVLGATHFLGGGAWHRGREADFGDGWEHMLHELLHYVVASGRLPRRRRWRRDAFSNATSRAIERAFPSPRRRDAHELTVLAMEVHLAGRLGLPLDRKRLAALVMG